LKTLQVRETLSQVVRQVWKKKHSKRQQKKKEGKNALEAEVTRPECAATHPAVQNNAEKQCF